MAPTNDPQPGGVAAPRLTLVLGLLFILAVLAQGAFAGGFIGGHHQWLTWHQNLGDLLIVLPLASLITGLVARRRQPDTRAVLIGRVRLLVLIAIVVITGHAGGAWLAVHIPSAIAAFGLAVWQTLLAWRSDRVSGRGPLPPHRL
jgi:hypothetical protein